MDPWVEALPQYDHIQQNYFSYRKHRKQKEEDIAICECKFDPNDVETTCGDTCLNVLTSTECTPGYCPCGVFCKNQRFQKCEYAKTRLHLTQGRGWGLLADQHIKAGQFIIEYCGEVISWKEARRRSHTYEKQGLKDAFIISLNSSESIDATKKGSLARFINHSCQPNCVTRKWNALGEIRVGIFAKQDIPIGTELAYNYNFEWYGGAKVRCLCGAASCSGFLGAKSRGFQEDTYLWEDDDDRYCVEEIPLYDSAEDEPSAKFRKLENAISEDDIARNLEYSMMQNLNAGSVTSIVKQLGPVSIEVAAVNPEKTETSKEINLYGKDAEQACVQKSAMIPLTGGNNAGRNNHVGRGHKPKKHLNGKSKNLPQEQVDAKHVAKLLAKKEAQEEVLIYEEMKNDAASQLSGLYDEIRPAIEEHERDNQDNVATSVAEKWIEVSCLKLKAEFDLYSSIIKNVACTPRRAPDHLLQPSQVAGNEVNYLGP
ncbi:Histone-lysine N-methyltransferase H3 lysine-36 specific [Euphorbia peplus]|nr:Histone-lysine N-methyltransferase H3 lysine-36 specific [Euphorbia peplus]